jgi:chromosome segregation ATPase
MNKKKINTISCYTKKRNKLATLTKCNSTNNLATKKINKTISKKIQKSNSIKTQIQERENEIELLNNKILDLKIKNYKIGKDIFQKLLNRKNITEKKNIFLNSINKLMHKDHNLNQILKEYETKINLINKEYEEISNEYDKKIFEVEKENNEIKKNIEEQNNLSIMQKKLINEKKLLIEILKKKVYDQNNINENRNKFYKEKYDKLKQQYSHLQEKTFCLYYKLTDKNPKLKIKYLIIDNNFLIDKFKRMKYLNKKNYSSENLFSTKDNSRKLSSTNYFTDRTNF